MPFPLGTSAARRLVEAADVRSSGESSVGEVEADTASSPPDAVAHTSPLFELPRMLSRQVLQGSSTFMFLLPGLQLYI
jgi:hypothetical protein